MFWSNKNSKKLVKGKSDKKGQTAQMGSDAGQRLREEALANARKARETIGDETIRKVAEILTKREQDPFIKAQEQLKKADPDRVLDCSIC